MKKTIPPKEGRGWPGHVLWGRVRTSTVVLLVAFMGCWWLYETYDMGAAPTQVPASNVVPPGFIPDPAYTWVPRTDVQRSDSSTTSTTPTTTDTTSTTPTSPGADETATDTPTSGAQPTPTTGSGAPSSAPTTAGPGSSAAPTPAATPSAPAAAAPGTAQSAVQVPPDL